ncbi:ABATE domain-containing protein [Frankia sp. QA3]|uniref:CGNR zinc finger domain-containing protein n=1 Tax=Frankia sp. QA3 TaxID=710111 RepID=UPI000269BE47|nr:CGNR zinc finger domain-containing protein [Frankia sp. QA3]EIV91886.1 Zn-ribbon-like motif-containing protein [Frankia sp. QA3]
MGGGQWFTDRAGTRWFFDSGALCLDFAYTGDLGHANPAWERLHSPGDLADWLTQRFGSLAGPVDATVLAAALGLRAAIVIVARALAVDAAPDPAAVDVVNAFAAGADLPPQLDGGTLAPPAPNAPRALATVARDAVRVFADGGARIRTCAADDCALVFHDDSRTNSRRWCSMRRCGNRAKVRAHRSAGPRSDPPP